MELLCLFFGRGSVTSAPIEYPLARSGNKKALRRIVQGRALGQQCSRFDGFGRAASGAMPSRT